MPKGVAVPYIIAIILGIVVIALLGYWLFVLGGHVGGVGTEQTCGAKKIAWCQQWSVNNFQGDCPATQFCTGPTGTGGAMEKWQSFAPGCGTTPPKNTECPLILGQSTATSTS
jgi:hypothetical protein